MQPSFELRLLIFLALAGLVGLQDACSNQYGSAEQVHTEESSVKMQEAREKDFQINNWIKTTVPLGKWADAIAFGDEGVRVIAGRGIILLSRDDGKSWKALNGGEASDRSTVDGGETYRDVNQLGEPLPSSVTVQRLCSVENAAITPSGHLYLKTLCEHTTELWSVPVRSDSGPWHLIGFTYKREPSDGVYSAEHDLVVVGDRVLVNASLPNGPAILSTDNDGATWYPFWRGSYADAGIVGLSFIDERSGWMLQGNGKLYNTTDGGRTWSYLSTLSNESAKTTYSLSFGNSHIGFIAGSQGRILRSSDGGRTWERQNSGVRSNLYKVVAADINRAWAVGENGTVLETSDGGAQWRKIELGIERDIRFSLTVKDRTAWIISGALIFHSL